MYISPKRCHQSYTLFKLAIWGDIHYATISVSFLFIKRKKHWPWNMCSLVYRPSHTMRPFCFDFEVLEASQTNANHRTPSHVSPLKSQQYGQSATHDGIFSYSPAMFIAAMVIRNTLLTILTHISYGSL